MLDSCFAALGRGNWGAMWIPRIGQEVLVSFFEGDPDRPVITGRVYNAEQMPPYTLPDNQTQSGFKSRSSKGGSSGNYNETITIGQKGERMELRSLGGTVIIGKN